MKTYKISLIRVLKNLRNLRATFKKTPRLCMRSLQEDKFVDVVCEAITNNKQPITYNIQLLTSHQSLLPIAQNKKSEAMLRLIQPLGCMIKI